MSNGEFMKYIAPFVLLSCLTLTASCRTTDLTVRSEYYNKEHLASYTMDTPDPRKNSSSFGQRLIINWSVPESTYQKGPLELVLRVRLKNGEEKNVKILLTKRAGQTFFPIFGNDFTKKGGLQSYFVELQSAGKTIDKNRHKLWVEMIKVNP